MMKQLIVCLSFLTVGVLLSCNKDKSSGTDTAAVEDAAAQTQSVAVAASSTTTGDSIYVVHVCNPRDSLATLDFSTLPSTITDYLTANYSGYTAVKAYSTFNSSGTLNGYVVIIQYNGNPVGLKFDANGSFVKVLEQREGHDLQGDGWHKGGCFDNRDGKHRDTLALSSLPASITAYLANNYAQDTLLSAFVKKNGEYVVISKNNGLYATVFTSAATFVSHTALPVRDGKITAVAADALPGTITSYLNTTYPGYVLDKAFVFTSSGQVKGYCVIIDSNNTKYGLLFDASGNFIKVKTIS
jgi:hypothetical protein